MKKLEDDKQQSTLGDLDDLAAIPYSFDNSKAILSVIKNGKILS